jgi:hypothetical protein
MSIWFINLKNKFNEWRKEAKFRQWQREQQRKRYNDWVEEVTKIREIKLKKQEEEDRKQYEIYLKQNASNL